MGIIRKVSGPLVIADEMRDANMFDVVRVSEMNLIGEIIEMRDGLASIQVYEETSGLGPGAPVTTTGAPLSVELGPGLIEQMFDGIQRPLDEILKKTGDRIARGIQVRSLNAERKWSFTPTVKAGDKVVGGDIIGEVPETTLVLHKVMIPPNLSGTIKEIKKGDFTIDDTVCVLQTDDGKSVNVKMSQKWPVRVGRPYKEKLSPSIPLITGQRIVDTMFPLAKGGVATIPGPFGSGKTVVQHQLAKWADADIIVYIGCGERGNEMTDVLNEFPELKDPKSGQPLMKRTLLIANTSDMPVAAREASIYTGITIAEYYRDMGYNVALLADSTSRWAEALREMSGRLEEMPGEEGYPAYLGTRLAQFYERAGRVKSIGSEPREGSLTAIGAVSPAGGDLSDPVAQATLRIVKVFWGLDSALAYRRHFPAINWLNSYSLYLDTLSQWYHDNVAVDWMQIRSQFMAILQNEAELNEIVQLVGVDALSADDRLTLEIARSIREDYLMQDSFNADDTYASSAKMYRMLKAIMLFRDRARLAIEKGVSIERISALPAREKLSRAKIIHEADVSTAFAALEEEIVKELDELAKEGA